jgi:hypothetical protein
MQRYIKIFMGRRKKQTSETEAKMEGSGDDREPQGLAYLAVEFHKTLNLIESNLVHHLQESQETSRREQAEITETLKKVDGNLKKIDENQIMITKLLMQMTHKGKDPETYGNKEAGGSGGSHGEIRYNLEKAPSFEGSHGGGTSHGQMGSRANPRPYLPAFTDGQVQQEHVDDFVEQMAQCTKEYYGLDMIIQRQMSLDQYCQLKFRNKPRTNHRSSFEFERRAGKIEIPYFDGTAKMTAQA